MIARILIWMILMIVLPDIYIYIHYLRHRLRFTWWKQLLLWTPCVIMLLYTIIVASSRSFAPDNMSILNTYLFLFGLFVLPKVWFALFSIIGLGFCKLFRKRMNWGNLLGVIMGFITIVIILYGSTIGFKKLDINHIDIYSSELPASFDGYRIVQFSDVHIGTYTGSHSKILARAIDSINAQHADMIVFTGDLQNMHPQEIYPHRELLRSLKAKDGVFSILGNHDYADYIKGDAATKAANEKETIRLERGFGWDLLLNEHRAVHRGKDSIVIAGEENDGEKPFPAKGDIRKTLAGVKEGAYIIMLQHDPTAWRRSILPNSNAQLTLSGHTHAGQFRLFGWSPSKLVYDEWCGLYSEKARALYISSGLGGFIPFRFGVSGEIAVITLHKSK